MPDEIPLYERYRDTLRRGHLAALTGAYPDALAAYREAAELIDHRAVPWLGIGRMELALGHRRLARRAFERALVVEPDQPDALAGLAATQGKGVAVPPRNAVPSRAMPDDGPIVRTVAGRWDVAREAGDVEGLLDAVIALARADRPAAATTALRDALTADPTEPRTYRVSAWLDRRAGRSDDARITTALLAGLMRLLDDGDELERRMADAEAAGDVGTLLEVSERHRRQDRPRAALEAAFAAMAIAPAEPVVHLAIARARLDLGARRRAIAGLEYLARSIELHEDAAGRAALARFVNIELAWPGAGSEAV
jgi:tetratricopeptide (TPR) repeat protein